MVPFAVWCHHRHGNANIITLSMVRLCIKQLNRKFQCQSCNVDRMETLPSSIHYRTMYRSRLVAQQASPLLIIVTLRNGTIATTLREGVPKNIRCQCVYPTCRFHFTTGKFPFEGDNVYKLFGVISTGVFEIPPDLSPLLRDLLRGTYGSRSA